MSEFLQRPKGIPEHAMLIEGVWISSDDNNRVIVHTEVEEDNTQYAQPETQPYYPPSAPRSEASFELKIVGNAPLSDLVRLAQPNTPPMQQSVSYPQYVPQQPVYAPAPAFPAYDYPSNVNQYEPVFPSSSAMTEPMPPIPTPQSNTYNTRQRSTPTYVETINNTDDEYEVLAQPHTSKRMVAIGALVAIALVSGPTIQASNSGERATEICAKNGIVDIFGNPGCFAAEFFNEFNAKNLFNFIPPEKK